MALRLRVGDEDSEFTQRIRQNIPRPATLAVIPSRERFQRRLRFPTEEELAESFDPALLPPISIPVSSVTPDIEPGGPGACLGLGGGVISFSATPVNGQTTILTTDLIPFPFVVNHIQWMINAAITDDVRVRFSVAPTIETDPALEIGWEHIILPWSNPDYHVGIGVGTMRQQFPNFKVSASNRAIKMSVENNAAAPHDVQAALSIQRLD